MDDAKVRVSLTNAIDERLVRRGQMSAENVRTDHIEAPVDTVSSVP
jgi:hypothetical protein